MFKKTALSWNVGFPYLPQSHIPICTQFAFDENFRPIFVNCTFHTQSSFCFANIHIRYHIPNRIYLLDSSPTRAVGSLKTPRPVQSSTMWLLCLSDTTSSWSHRVFVRELSTPRLTTSSTTSLLSALTYCNDLRTRWAFAFGTSVHTRRQHPCQHWFPTCLPFTPTLGPYGQIEFQS